MNLQIPIYEGIAQPGPALPCGEVRRNRRAAIGLFGLIISSSHSEWLPDSLLMLQARYFGLGGAEEFFFFSKDAASHPIQLLRDAFALQGCCSFTAVTAHQPARKMPLFCFYCCLSPMSRFP
jgi:hypothetical protein